MTTYASLRDARGMVVSSAREKMFLVDPTLGPGGVQQLPLVSAYPTVGWYVPGDSVDELDARYSPYADVSEHEISQMYDELRDVWPQFGRDGDAPDR